ncbi:MAG: SGNH/GDSL hydrolase family protein [Candidatus Electrothrix sp. Rat3]|nr:SGNH/GDSL hydrolase family protein [Candidatus Electrothrix rattekaaiensis]
MAERITFSEFKKALDSRTITVDSLKEYVEFDDESPVPKLIFRKDALIDSPPEQYDVDEEIYRLLRSLDEKEDADLPVYYWKKAKLVLAEGDSWYNLPWFLRPPAIADWIKKNKRFRLKNIARWGDTLKEILDQNEYLTAIDEYRPDFFMLCGGGNDLQEGLANGQYIHFYDESRDVDDYLTEKGIKGLADIEIGLKQIISDVAEKYPSLPILTHGYDYPRPLVGNGKYIGKYLRRMGFPDDKMQPIVDSVIDRLNHHVKTAASAYKTAVYIDCRNATKNFIWYDDMHPGRDGFLALSILFEEKMNNFSKD